MRIVYTYYSLNPEELDTPAQELKRQQAVSVLLGKQPAIRVSERKVGSVKDGWLFEVSLEIDDA